MTRPIVGVGGEGNTIAFYTSRAVHSCTPCLPKQRVQLSCKRLQGAPCAFFRAVKDLRNSPNGLRGTVSKRIKG